MACKESEQYTTYEDNAIPCGKRYNISAGNHSWTNSFQFPLNAIDFVETFQGPIRNSILFG